MLGARAKSALRIVTGFGAAWALVWPMMRLFRIMAGPWWGGSDWSWGAYMKERIGEALALTLPGSYLVAVMAATVLVPLALAARMVARARVRAGHVDPFARVREWMATHRRRTLALAALAPTGPVAFGTVVFVDKALLLHGSFLDALARVGLGHPIVIHGVRLTVPDQLLVGAIWAIPAALALAALTTLTRAGLRALVAPVAEGEPVRADVAGNEIVFDAVAVAGETRAAVGGMAALTMAMVTWVATTPSATLYYHHTAIVAAIAAYVTLAVGGALLFRRTSRVAIGLDGVHVTGSSRTRFFAYREIDDAAQRGDDLVLLRGTRVVLRLQLHGKDAARREAVLERVRGAIKRAKAERHDATTSFVSAASREDLTRAAFGAGDYREASVSREQLWAVVEGPSLDVGAREAAAAALVKSGDAESRERLRVTADNCADPRVRVALQKVCESEDLEALPNEAEDAEDAPAPRRALPRLTR
jgi:hypothetical protein